MHWNLQDFGWSNYAQYLSVCGVQINESFIFSPRTCELSWEDFGLCIKCWFPMKAKGWHEPLIWSELEHLLLEMPFLTPHPPGQWEQVNEGTWIFAWLTLGGYGFKAVTKHLLRLLLNLHLYMAPECQGELYLSCQSLLAKQGHLI